MAKIGEKNVPFYGLSFVLSGRFGDSMVGREIRSFNLGHSWIIWESWHVDAIWFVLYIVYKKHFSIINSIFCLFICRLFIGCITSAFVLAIVVFAITLYVLIMFFIDRDSLKSLTGKQLITLSCIFKLKLW